MQNLCLMIVLAPLLGAVVTGLFGKDVGRNGAHWITILGVGVSFVLSAVVFWADRLRRTSRLQRKPVYLAREWWRVLPGRVF